jgi:hypothetical protein
MGRLFLARGISQSDNRGSEDVCSVFKRKLNTFRKDPLASSFKKIQVLPRAIAVWTFKSERIRTYINHLCQLWAQHQLHKREYLDFLRIRPLHAIPPDFADLWFLYKTVRRRKPRCILEFGSGCSTVILTQALWDNQSESPNNVGYLYSLDTDPYWADITAKSMPQHLQGLYEISYSPILEVEYEGRPAFRYAKVPNITPDFLYLDGPPLTPEREVAVDVLDIEERFPPGFCLIIDGRRRNTIFLRRYLKKQYIFKSRWLFQNYVFELITPESRL